MTPFKTFLSIISLFVALAVVAVAYPEGGIQVGSTTLRYPKLTDIFEKAQVIDSTSDSIVAAEVDPEIAIQEMMAETRKQEFSAYTDSLKFFEDFFREGKTRFDLPNNDPAWFDRFFLNLQLAAVDSSIIHVIHYGDSQLEEDRISCTIREMLQTEFGGNGPGLMPAVMRVASQTTSNSYSGNLQRYMLFAPDSEFKSTHNRYGPLAQYATLNGSATLTIKKREDKNKQFEHVGGYKTIRLLAAKKGNLKAKLFYEKTTVEVVGINKDSTVKEKRTKKMVEADSAIIDTSYTKLKVITWKLPDTTSSIKVNLSGFSEIYGISVDGPYGVAVDNVAMRGSSGTIFHNINPELLAESYKAMNARLIIMEYGGNLVPGTSKANIGWTKKIITRQIQTIQKANPDADIIFIGPADMARQVDGKLQTYSGLGLAIQALREVALENGLAYWDMHRVMGGNGSMIKWVKKNPPLGFTDHIHFTRKGAAYMGELFSNAIRMHYDYFQFRDRHQLNDEKLKDIHSFADSLKQVAVQDSIKHVQDSIRQVQIQDSIKHVQDSIQRVQDSIKHVQDSILRVQDSIKQAHVADSLKAIAPDTSKATPDTIKAEVK